jgi:hypothetical protein
MADDSIGLSVANYLKNINEETVGLYIYPKRMQHKAIIAVDLTEQHIFEVTDINDSQLAKTFSPIATAYFHHLVRKVNITMDLFYEHY